MVASLPMYDWPDIREATDTWWAIIAEALRLEGIGDVPDQLLHDAELSSVWEAPTLLLSQTCGYPLTHAWDGRLQIVATPHYGVEGCDGSDYCSFVLVRCDSGYDGLEALRGATVAYNGEDSQSGYSALRAAVAPFAQNGRFFGSAVRSGAHLNSLQMVRDGDADVCATDAVVWALARRHRPELVQGVRVLEKTPSAPGLPYVTSPFRSEDNLRCMRNALASALLHPSFPAVRDAIHITGFSVLEREEYSRIVSMERDSIASGYAELR